jgi:hypothetical protein
MRKKQRRVIRRGGDQWHGVHVAEHEAAVADDIHVRPARASKLPNKTTSYSGDRMNATHTRRRPAHVQTFSRYSQAEKGTAGQLDVRRLRAAQLHDGAVNTRRIANVIRHGFKCRKLPSVVSDETV